MPVIPGCNLDKERVIKTSYGRFIGVAYLAIWHTGKAGLDPWSGPMGWAHGLGPWAGPMGLGSRS